MEAVGNFSETLVITSSIVWHKNLEYQYLNLHCHEISYY